jgi:ATP-binding cassette, subfamily B, bacterial
MRSDLVRTLRLVFKNTPGWTLAGVFFIIILGFLPLISLFVIKLLVDTVTLAIQSPDQTRFATQLIFLIIAAAGIGFLTALCNAGSAYVNEVQSLEMTKKITAIIQSHSVKLDLGYYENPQYQDTLHRAQEEGPLRPTMIVNDLVRIGQNCISITAVGLLIITFSPLVGIGLIIAAVPAAAFRIWHSNKLYLLHLHQTELERKNWYYHMILTHAAYAKEVRLYNLGPFFTERYHAIQQELIKTRLANSRSRLLWEILAEGFVTVAMFGSLSVILLLTLRGDLSLGDMVMYFMGFQMCIGYAQAIFGSVNSLYEDQLFLNNLFAFLDLKPRIERPKKPVRLPAHIQHEICMESVTFTYPGEHAPALTDINLTLHKGEVIALVGANGAGKSTLIKLLCGLYTPDRGTITIDGVNSTDVDQEEWQKHITVLFQDYVHYDLTAQENISLGESERSADISEVDRAARMSGIDEVIRNLPDGYRTMLGNFFSNGHELSSGEWQKVALARAFFRGADIVILDEPASSLDALAEAEIFAKFRMIIEGKAAVLISHRFSTLLRADHIYVIERGRIIEHGNHGDLMIQNGRYAAMFRAQADPYLE